MTKEELVQQVSMHLNRPLDPVGVQVIETAWEILSCEQEVPAGHRSSTGFRGENLPVAAYEAMDESDKASLMAQLEADNEEWLKDQFEDLQADWLILMEGRIVGHGRLPEYPTDEELDSLCERSGGKYPWVFENPRLSLIEEGRSLWNPTHAPDDAYPSLPVEFASARGALQLVADLDTGAPDVYADLNGLEAHHVLTVSARAQWSLRGHLGDLYRFVRRPLLFRVTDTLGATREIRWMVACVRDWQQSPFVRINPKRRALIGRAPLLALKPRISLDFQRRTTEVHPPNA